MRVLFVVGSLRAGGHERQVTSVARELHRRGIECRVLCLTELGVLAASLVADGVPVELFGRRSLAGVRRLRPDVVYAYGFVAYVLALPVAAVLVPRALRASARSHEAALDIYARFPRLSWLARRLTNPTTHVVVGNDRTVVDTHVAEDEAIRNRSYAIHNGVAIPPLPASPDRSTRLLCIANFRPEKAHEVLFDAIRRLPLDREWTLDLLGDGPRRTEVEALVAGLPEPSRVVVHGTREDVGAVLAASALLVLSSRTEGSPNVVFEAMAAGLPIVSTRVGSVPTLLADGGGVVVEVGDDVALAGALLRYIDDPGLRLRDGATARRLAARYGIEITVDRHLAVFDEHLATLGRAAR